MRIFVLASLASLIVTLIACTKEQPASASAQDLPIAVLPTEAFGDFTGVLVLSEGGVAKKSHGNVVARVEQSGDRYQIVFSGGMPAVDSDVPILKNVLFAAVPGSQQGVYQSKGTDGSPAGIMISTYMPNLNVETPAGRYSVAFTGRK